MLLLYFEYILQIGLEKFRLDRHVQSASESAWRRGADVVADDLL